MIKNQDSSIKTIKKPLSNDLITISNNISNRLENKLQNKSENKLENKSRSSNKDFSSKQKLGELQKTTKNVNPIIPVKVVPGKVLSSKTLGAPSLKTETNAAVPKKMVDGPEKMVDGPEEMVSLPDTTKIDGARETRLKEPRLREPRLKEPRLRETRVTESQKRIRILGRYYQDRLFYSHLDFQYYKNELRNLGWVETKDPSRANMILCSYWKNIMKWIPTLTDPRFSHRRLVIWTHEPYHDLHVEDANKVIINNVYTGKVFKDNYRYFRWGDKDLLSELTDTSLTDAEFQSRKFPLLALSTKYPKTYWNPNKQTLLPRRYEVIEYGLKHSVPITPIVDTTQPLAQLEQPLDQSLVQKLAQAPANANANDNDKMCKVWGKGWPDGLAQGESRTAMNREEEKKKILRSGLFNIAIENTDAPFYVTEKIWECIESYCLPIYWPNSTIYQDFPTDSFIDAKVFYEKWGKRWVEKLYKYIQDMTRQEYIERLNRCIRTFNLLCTKGLAKNLRTDAQNRDLHIVDYSRNWEDLKKIFV